MSHRRILLKDNKKFLADFCDAFFFLSGNAQAL
jgi:hypothetical protein